MKRLVMMLGVVLFCVAGVQADRKVVLLNGRGWTADGVPVNVPHTWNVEDAADGAPGEKVAHSAQSRGYVRKAVTYARRLPDAKKGKRYFLRCEGVSITADVAVNQQAVGRHVGAFTGFCFEITAAMKPTGNQLTIVADNTFNPDIPPIGGDFSMFGGVYRNVWLIETDPVCIDPTVDGGPGVAIEADPATGEVRVTALVSGADDADMTYEVRGTGVRSKKSTFIVPKNKVIVWSPENPQVYRLRVTVRKGASVDSVEQPFGFRSWSFSEKGFVLNGVARQIRGVNRHQDREGKGWAVSEQDERGDIARIKEMGADGLRLAHYPQSENIYDLCDAMGLIVWSEVPAVDAITMSDTFRTNYLTMIREMIAQHRNHPSVMMWGIFNEMYHNTSVPKYTAEPLLTEGRDLMHALDPSRTVVAASNQQGRKALNTIPDQIAFNIYPGWYGGNADSIGGVLKHITTCGKTGIAGVSEYGHGASIHHQENPFKRPTPTGRFHPESYQAWAHMMNYKGIRANPKIWGSFIWAMFDFASDCRSEGEKLGMNDKGLVTYDRATPKDAFYFYKANWTEKPLLHLVGQRMTETASEAVTVLGFSSYSGEVTLLVNGSEYGRATPDVVRTVIWEKVPLKVGKNTIELRAGTARSRATWTRKEK